MHLLEIYLTASLMLGFMVRVSGILAGFFTFNLLIGLYNDGTEWPWTGVGIICAHGMFAATQAGRSLGLDNLIAKGLVRSRPRAMTGWSRAPSAGHLPRHQRIVTKPA